jgi:hypothetical protein
MTFGPGNEINALTVDVSVDETWQNRQVPQVYYFTTKRRKFTAVS